MKNIKKDGDIITFDATGDETFKCKFNIMTGETETNTDCGTILAMAKLRLFSVLTDKGELPSELVAMSW